jgi:hypothetical protein
MAPMDSDRSPEAAAALLTRHNRERHLRESSKREYVSPMGMAFAYARLGKAEQVLAWLEKQVCVGNLASAYRAPPVVIVALELVAELDVFWGCQAESRIFKL